MKSLFEPLLITVIISGTSVFSAQAPESEAGFQDAHSSNVSNMGKGDLSNNFFERLAGTWLAKEPIKENKTNLSSRITCDPQSKITGLKYVTKSRGSSLALQLNEAHLSTPKNVMLHICVGMNTCQEPPLPDSAEDILTIVADSYESLKREIDKITKQLKEKPTKISHLLLDMHGSSSEGGGELSIMSLKNKSIVLNPFKLKQYKPYIPAIFRKPESEILNLDQEKYIVIDSQSDHAKWPFKNLNEYFHNDMKVFFATCFLFYGESSARLAKAKLLAKLMGIRKGWIWGAYHVHAQFFTIGTPLGFVDASLPFSTVDNSDDKSIIDISEMMESMKDKISGFSFEITEGEVKNVKSGYMYDFFFFDFLGGKQRPVTDEQLKLIEIIREQMIQE